MNSTTDVTKKKTFMKKITTALRKGLVKTVGLRAQMSTRNGELSVKLAETAVPSRCRTERYKHKGALYRTSGRQTRRGGSPDLQSHLGEKPWHKIF